MNRKQRRQEFKKSRDFRKAGFNWQDANKQFEHRGLIQDPTLVHKDKSRMGAKRRSSMGYEG